MEDGVVRFSVAAMMMIKTAIVPVILPGNFTNLRKLTYLMVVCKSALAINIDCSVMFACYYVIFFKEVLANKAIN